MENNNQQKKKTNIYKILSYIFLLLAIIPLIYLVASRIQLHRLNMKSVTTYVEAQYSEEELEKIKRQKEAYNKKVKTDFTPTTEPQHISDNNDTVIGVLYIPRIAEVIPIYFGTSDEILSKGVGIMEKTSLPGGMGSNCVLTGHRGTHNAKLFRYLDKLEMNDPVYIYTNNDLLKYKIFNHAVIQPDDGRLLTLEKDRDKITLLTCTPYLINTERLLYFGERAKLTKSERDDVLDIIKNGNKKKLKQNSQMKDTNNREYSKIIYILAILVIILLLLLIIYILYKLLRNKDNADKEE